MSRPVVGTTFSASLSATILRTPHGARPLPLERISSVGVGNPPRSFVSYGVSYAVGNVLLALWGTVIVMLMG